MTPPSHAKPAAGRRPLERFGPKSRDGDEDQGPVWLFGVHAVTAALRNPARTHHRLVATRNAARHLDAPPLEPQILSPDGITGMLPPGAVHQGLGLLTDPLGEPDLEASVFPLETGRPVLVLDRVTDPHNVGAVLRSAAVFDARAVVTTRRRSPPLTGTLAKAATGAIEHVPYIRVQNLARAIERLREGGYATVGLAEDGDAALPDMTGLGPTAILLGAEGDGLRPLTRNLCDRLARIPTPGPLGALNVSNAAAIALYHVTTQSRSPSEA